MKFKTTAKEIRNYGGKVVRAGYCDLQHLLRGVEPVAYTCGVYGWNFDDYGKSSALKPNTKSRTAARAGFESPLLVYNVSHETLNF